MADVAMTREERSNMKLRANGEQKWTPQKIVRLYVYAFLYDRIRANPTEFGLPSNTADNRVVEGIISSQTESLMHKYNVYQMIPGGFNIDTFKTELARGDYSTDAKKYFNGYLKKPMGEFLTMQDMNEILLKKYDDCHKKMLDIKIPTDLDTGLMTFDSKTNAATPKDFSKDYYYLQKMRAAEETLKSKKKLIRRINFRFFRNALLTAAFLAAGIGSLGLIFSGGGALLAGLFGTTLFATGAGAAVTGTVGVIASVLLGRISLGKAIKYFHQRRKQKEDLRDYLNGVQKYAPEGKEFKGYKDIKREFENAYTIRAIMIDDVRLFMDGDKDKGIKGYYHERFEQIKREQDAYQKAYEKFLRDYEAKHGKGAVPDEKELLALRKEYLKTPYPTENEMVDDYRAYVRKKYPKFCKKSNMNVLGQQPWQEVAKNAIYDYEVSSENSIFRKVAGVLDPQVYTSNAVNNPSVGELAADINKADNIYSLDGLKQLYKDFTDTKNVDRFTEGNAGRYYAQLLSELGTKISARIEDIAFKEPLTSKTADDIKDALKDPQLQKAIEDAGVGGMTSKLKNRQVFISVESANEKAGYKTLQNDIGVSVLGQLHFDAKSIEGACEAFEDEFDAAKKPELESIARDIAKLSTRADSSAISTRISGLSGCPKTTKYLEFMLKKKTDAIALTKSDIEMEFDDKGIRVLKEIKNDIAGLTEADCCAIAGNMSGSAKVKVSGKLDEIKKKIMELPDRTPDEIETKKRALACLDKQVKAIEMARRNRSLESACDNLEADDNASEIMEKIAALKYGEFNKEEGGVVEIYRTINSCSNAEYFKMKLSERIYELCISESNKSEIKSVGIETLGNLINFFMNVRGCNYLTQGQKDEIMRHTEEQFAESLNRSLRNLIRNLLEGDNVKTYSGIVKKLLDNNYQSGGLTEYFESKTSGSQQIEELLQKIRKICDNATAAFFAQDVKGIDTELTKVPLEYILDIPIGNVIVLVDNFTAINEVEGKIRNSPNAVTAAGVDIGKVIEPLYQQLDKINAIKDDPKKRLAELMILKQMCISLHKFTLASYIRAHGTNDYRDYMSHHLLETKADLGAAWTSSYKLRDRAGKVIADRGIGFIQALDAAIDACLTDPKAKKLYDNAGGAHEKTSKIIEKPFGLADGVVVKYITNDSLLSM